MLHPMFLSSSRQINLRLILVSGKTKDFLFDPNDSAADIAQYVFDHWPQGKPSCFLLLFSAWNALSVGEVRLHACSPVCSPECMT